MKWSCTAVALLLVGSWAAVAWADEPPSPAPIAPTVPAGAKPPEQVPLAGYDGGFFIQSPDQNFKLRIGGRVQFRFEYEGADEDDDSFAFSIPRARLRLRGHAFTPDLLFDIHVDFGKGGIPTLKDGLLEYRVIKDVVHVRAGQTKVPWMRQQIASDSRLSLVDRAITDKAFGGGRDLGIMVHDNYEKSPELEYAVGLFNGTSDKPVFEDGKQSNVPDRFRPQVAARVGYNYGKIEGYDEVDFDKGDVRFGFAANARTSFDTADEHDGLIEAGGDFIVKLYGLSFNAALMSRWVQVGTGYDEQKFDRLGMLLGAGYLIGDHVQPALRYARVVPHAPDEAAEQEILGGISVFAFEHSVKAVLDGGPIVREEAVTRVDWQLRTQLQLVL